MVEIATAHVNLVARFDPNIPRIQVLELPTVQSGDRYATPFALVFDGADPEDEQMNMALESFKDAVGASAVLVTKTRISV